MAQRSATDWDVALPVGRPADEVADAVRAMCRRLYAVEGEFIRRFRESLAQLVPELRYTTPDEGAAIAEGLARAILWAALTPEPADVVEVTFRGVGAEYAGRGFPESGYHGAGHTLLRAARDTQITEWTSELSSAWVAYYNWLSEHLTAGARAARDVPAPAPSPVIPPPVTALARDAPGPSTLDEVLDLLRSRYFSGNERSLGAILSRVALRTGADLRAPRPDQRRNPAVVANVVAVLQVMGYVLQPSGAPALPRGYPAPSRESPPRWWSRRR